MISSQGGAGGDTLSGGADADVFVFDRLDSTPDSISDFVASDGDRIQISATGFGGGLTAGVLTAEQFVVGAAAVDSSDRLICDPSTRILSFDADGSGAQAAVQVTSVGELTHTDIVVI
ncbi:MAG: hypothetical protein ACFBSF_19840 [Leptolyngbyaceae cyanobacterium]